MRKANGIHVALPKGERLKHTSRAAEFELAHLEEMIRAVLRSEGKGLNIGTQYWRTRFRQFESAYAFLPVQQKRVEALERMIADIETLDRQGASSAGAAA